MIRGAGRYDLDSVYSLMRQLSSHDFTKEQFEACYYFNLERDRILVYEDEEAICGCIVYEVHYPMHYSRKTAEIVNLIVDENCRNNGVGKELLASFERLAIENGCVRMEVDTNKQREGAQRLYSREGFEPSHFKLTKELKS